MNYDKKIIKTWINNIISVIAQIADLEFQKKAWLEGRSFLSISYAETICQLYDSHQFRAFLKESDERKWLPENILTKLKTLNVELEKHLDDHGTCDLIESDLQTDPEWHRIQTFAKEILKDFKELGFNPPDLTKIEYLDPP